MYHTRQPAWCVELQGRAVSQDDVSQPVFLKTFHAQWLNMCGGLQELEGALSIAQLVRSPKFVASVRELDASEPLRSTPHVSSSG
jgi:hypothetical protein